MGTIISPNKILLTLSELDRDVLAFGGLHMEFAKNSKIHLSMTDGMLIVHGKLVWGTELLQVAGPRC